MEVSNIVQAANVRLTNRHMDTIACAGRRGGTVVWSGESTTLVYVEPVSNGIGDPWGHGVHRRGASRLGI